MKNKRRDFIKITGAAGLGIAGNIFNPFSSKANVKDNSSIPATANSTRYKKEVSVIGAYGAWAASLISHDLPSLSFRRNEFNDIDTWRNRARQRLADRLNIPNIGELPKVTVKKEYQYDGLHIEELSWQLPYGNATEAILLKPLNAKGKLPGILAFHDHGGNKYFGRRKITKTSDKQHPLMVTHQDHYYEGTAWANEIAKHGYVVLVSDAFAFASRRVLLADVTEKYRRGVTDDNPEQVKSIEAYNKWASEHEHVMAKSLFCAGTTWPSVFFAEDQKALDILCAREDVDADRIGCGGLSGGGIRTDFMGGLDPRIKCAVTVGFMTTWQDFLLNKSPTHTWMAYVPLLPNELDFPEILGLRAPLPTMVLNDEEDQLYTLPEMKQADKILQEIYTKANASSHYKSSYYPGLHKFDKQMQSDAFDWFDKWLKA